MMKKGLHSLLLLALLATMLVLFLARNANAYIARYPYGGSTPVNVQGCSEIPYIAQTVNALVPWYCSQINVAVYNDWAKWEPIALLAVLVSFFIGTMIFVTGIVLRNEKIRTFGIGEIYESIATAIIALMFTFFAAVMFGLLPGFFVGPIDPYNASLVYINQTISATENLMRSAFDVNMLASFYSSISLQIETSGVSAIPSWVFPVYASIINILFVAPATAIAQLLSDGLLVLHTEFYTILFGMYAAIPVFLIPGIIMRAILPTRSVGGMFIGIAIGFYFVLPILFSVAFAFTNHGLLQQFAAETAALNQYGSGSGAESNAISPTSPLVTTIGNMESTLSSFWLSVVFFPALILALTYTSITIIADFIGGMATTSSRLRLM